MLQIIIRKIILIPVVLFFVSFAGFSYTYIALQIHRASSPYGSSIEGYPPVFTLYGDYLNRLVHFDFGVMPVGNDVPILDGLIPALGGSLGLLALAFIISTIIGLAIGLNSIRTDPPSVMPWLTPFSTIGLAIPGFYLGILLIVGLMLYILHSPQNTPPPLPIIGFGWDNHLVLPLLALIVRPTIQLAQVTAQLLSSELGKQYVIATRAMGRSWHSIRWKYALRNVLAPILIFLSSSFRLLIAELILVEWLFQWNGVGRLLALTLVPPGGVAPGGLIGKTAYFLHPELFTALITLFTLLFLLTDFTTTLAVRASDPRLRTA